MNRSDYERYLQQFNARDYDGVLSHFADHFELVFAGYVFRTKEEVRRFYAFLHGYVNETVTVHSFVSDGRTVALEADVQLEGIKDLTLEILAEHGYDRIVGLKAGEIVTIPQFIHYHLEDGKIVRALCAVYEPPVVAA
jgi:hypothetical protein